MAAYPGYCPKRDVGENPLFLSLVHECLVPVAHFSSGCTNSLAPQADRVGPSWLTAISWPGIVPQSHQRLTNVTPPTPSSSCQVKIYNHWVKIHSFIMFFAPLSYASSVRQINIWSTLLWRESPADQKCFTRQASLQYKVLLARTLAINCLVFKCPWFLHFTSLSLLIQINLSENSVGEIVLHIH